MVFKKFDKTEFVRKTKVFLCKGFNNDVVFCASFDDQKHCHVWSEDGKFKKTRSTSESHFLGGLARYKSSVILFSGQEDDRGTTEMLEERGIIRTFTSAGKNLSQKI